MWLLRYVVIHFVVIFPYREAKKKHVQLIKDRKVFDAKIGVMNEQCNTMMIQKFGRIVDLEKLETVTVNRQIEELKEKLRVAEIQCSTEIIKWDVSGFSYFILLISYNLVNVDNFLAEIQCSTEIIKWDVSVTYFVFLFSYKFNSDMGMWDEIIKWDVSVYFRIYFALFEKLCMT